jgi:hypothetical protein
VKQINEKKDVLDVKSVKVKQHNIYIIIERRGRQSCESVVRKTVRVGELRVSTYRNSDNICQVSARIDPGTWGPGESLALVKI